MFVLLLGLAFADEVDTSPETCLLEYYDADHCVSCEASYEGSEDCEALGAEGREKACQSSGASVWSEIWCDPGFTEAIGEPATGNGVCGGGKSAAGVGFAAMGLALTLSLARRRRDA